MITSLINFLIQNGIDVWEIVKWVYVAAFILCLVCSLVVLRQIQLMARTLAGSFNTVIYLLGAGLVVAAGVGLVGALVVL